MKHGTLNFKLINIMKKIVTALTIFASTFAFSQVGIGTTSPHSSSILDLTATNKAMLLPRVANTAAIPSPANGMMIYDISSNCIKSYENGAWTSCLSNAPATAPVVVDCNTNAFTGNYYKGSAMTASNKFSVTITNNSFTAATIAFQTSDLVLSGVTGISVASVSISSVTLNAGQSQLVEYILSGTSSASGTLTGTWTKLTLNCVKTVAVTNPAITSLACGTATKNGTLTGGTAASGVSSVISYTGGDGSAHSGQTVTSTGVTGLTATLAAGNFATGAGSLTYTITGTPSAGGTASFAINIGGKSCTLTRTVAAAIMFRKVTKYNGVSVINNQGIGYNGEAIPASSTIEIEVNVTDATPYSFTATDATTGLTYSASGNFTTSGTKLVTLINNGTSIAWDKYGTINMTLTGANNTLALAPRIDVKSIPASATEVVNVTYGGQTWMDRNLGARRVATAINDVLSYGNHYQWGRPADGHEISVWNGEDTPTSGRGFYNATALEALATSDAPGHPNFILTNNNVTSYDWRSNNNNNRWATANQGPCPVGYHVPTEAQWATAYSFGAWNNNTDTYNSALKLPSAGYRHRIDGLLYTHGTIGLYWSSTVSGTHARRLHFFSTAATTNFSDDRAFGFTVRCLKD